MTLERIQLVQNPRRYLVRFEGFDVMRARSSTNFLSKARLTNYDGIPEFTRQAATTRGTNVHEAIAAALDNTDPLDVVHYLRAYPEYAGYFTSFSRLFEHNDFVTVFTEYRVANLSPLFAGTLDWLGFHRGVPTILDWATGSPFDACKHLQLASYIIAARCWARQPGQERLRAFLDKAEYIERIGVRLMRDGSLPQLSPYRDGSDYQKFLLLAQCVNMIDSERPLSVSYDWKDDDAD